MLVGTKDGQAWRSWQIIDPDLPGNPAITANAATGANAALQVLSLMTQGAGQSSRPLDLSA